MTFNAEDNDEKQPIDLFAPRNDGTVSIEGFAFPVEEFIPSMKQEIPDQPTSVVPVVEQNYEINPNNPDGVQVDDVQTATIPNNVNLGNPSTEDANSTSTPLSPDPEPENPEDGIFISLESDIALIDTLSTILEEMESAGGICKDDVNRIEEFVPGIITNVLPINRFSSVVGVAGYTPSCESISTYIRTLVDRVIEAIDGLIKKLLSGNATASVFITKANSVRWNDLIEKAKRIDSLKGRIDYSARIAGESSAAKKASTAVHFVKLYSAEIYSATAQSVPAGFNLVANREAATDLRSIEKSLNSIINSTRNAVRSNGIVNSEPVDVVQWRTRYLSMVPGIKRPIEALVTINCDDDIVKRINTLIDALKGMQQDLESKRNSSQNAVSGDSLRSALQAVRAADTYNAILSVVLNAYKQYNNILTTVITKVDSALPTIR